MTFAIPPDRLIFWAVAAVAALAALGLALRMLDGQRRRRLDAFVRADLAPRLLAGYDARMRRPLTWLTLAGFVFLIVAVAQPHWGASLEEVRQHSRDVIVCLDTSESMNAEDIRPNRLERAKRKIALLLDRAPGDRFGLVAFSGGAALQCPLTLDHAYFRAVLNAVDTNTITREGTDIAAALEEAVAALREEDERSTARSREARAILLISDGEKGEFSDEGGDDPVTAAAREAAAHARIYVMGVGDPAGAEVRRPAWMNRFVPFAEMNRTHLSRLDEELLSQIALIGDGRYVRSTADDFDLNQVLAHLRGLAGRDVEGEVRRRYINRYQWFLGAALACFAAEGLWLAVLPWLRRRRLRRREPRGEAQHA